MDRSTIDRDKQLWNRLRESDETALSELFHLYAESLYQYGFLICKDKETVEDCLQDLFFRIWKKRHQLTPVEKVHTYLLIALRNRIHNTFRKVQGIPLNECNDEQIGIQTSREIDWIEDETQSIHRQFVRQAVDTLPSRMKQALYLRYFEQKDYTDIADIMKISKQVAVNMVHRATQKLRLYSKQYSDWFTIITIIISHLF
ncbi:MAG: sigma-70 family RNA polymerase sigma factor [Saprospiraceae bacterium]|nr:sigma-70 family RNA polymerase sigma factor [Lewinella sp.]